MSLDFPTPDVVGIVITDGKQSKVLQPFEDSEQALNGLRSYARSLRKRNPDYQVHIVRFTASAVVEEPSND